MGPSWRYLGPPRVSGILQNPSLSFGVLAFLMLGLLGLSFAYLPVRWLILGPLGAILGPLGPSYGRLGALLGPLGVILGPSWALLGQSCDPLGLSWGHLGALLGPLGATLGSSWPILAPSWATLRPPWGNLAVLWALFGPLGAILRLFLNLLGAIFVPRSRFGGHLLTRAASYVRPVFAFRPQCSSIRSLSERSFLTFPKRLLASSPQALKPSWAEAGTRSANNPPPRASSSGAGRLKLLPNLPKRFPGPPVPAMFRRIPKVVFSLSRPENISFP